jgi:hypothetical protein
MRHSKLAENPEEMAIHQPIGLHQHLLNEREAVLFSPHLYAEPESHFADTTWILLEDLDLEPQSLRMPLRLFDYDP